MIDLSHLLTSFYICFKGLDGISIVEVYSITYLGSSPVKAEDQNGSICIKTNQMCYSLYHESKVDTSKPSIKYGDQLPMRNVGPICNFTDLELKFDLFSRTYKGSKYLFSRKDGDWLVKRSLKSIDGYQRNISVLFGCFSNATVANVKVMFLPDVPFSDATTDVYGVVVATNSKFDHPSSTSYLFYENPNDTIEVEHNDVIPLSQSRVGVPLDSQFYVDISLSCDGIQYKGTAEFTPGKNKKDSKMVSGQILVKVTWNCSEDSDSSDEDSNYADEDWDQTDEDSDFASEYEFDGTVDIEEEISETVT